MKLNSYIDANKDKSFYVYIYFLIYTSSPIIQNVKNDIAWLKQTMLGLPSLVVVVVGGRLFWCKMLQR